MFAPRSWSIMAVVIAMLTLIPSDTWRCLGSQWKGSTCRKLSVLINFDPILHAPSAPTFWGGANLQIHPRRWDGHGIVAASSSLTPFDSTRSLVFQTFYLSGTHGIKYHRGFGTVYTELSHHLSEALYSCLGNANKQVHWTSQYTASSSDPVTTQLLGRERCTRDQGVLFPKPNHLGPVTVFFLSQSYQISHGDLGEGFPRGG
ncbi:hypothetical protein V8B97DRAFT_1302148 [Scleroderma yunnanense]